MPRGLVIGARLGDAVRLATARLLLGHVRVLTAFSPMRFGLKLADYQRDEAACRLLGVPSVRLAEPALVPEAAAADRDRRLDELAARFTPYLAECAEIWLPSGLGRDAARAAARDAGLRAAARAERRVQIWLYADVAWGTAVTEPASPRVLTERLERALGSGLTRPHLTQLDESARARRRAVVACLSPAAGLPAQREEDHGGWVQLAWQFAGIATCDRAIQGGTNVAG